MCENYEPFFIEGTKLFPDNHPTRGFSVLLPGGTMCHYRSLFVSIRAFNGAFTGRFYRFEHIGAYGSGKVVAEWLHRRPKADGENATHKQTSPTRLKKFFNT